MIQAFRTIDVPIEMQEGEIRMISVPLDVELMERIEETTFKAQEKPWWRVRPSDETIRDAFLEFCKPYLPEDFPYQKAQPTFPALFFSHCRTALNDSINNCMKPPSSTEESA